MFRTLKKFLLPHHTNNHRAKILHNSSLVVVILLFLFVSFTAVVVNNTHPEILGVSYSISEADLVAQVNSQRQASGLAPLSHNPQLDDAARRKASDMLAKNYWAHFSPDGSTSPWTFIRDAGYTYSFAGENLAKGFTDSGSVVSAWMDSPSHRGNILSDKYKDVGFAIVSGTLQGEETVLVVQMFGSRNSDTVAQIPVEAAESQNTQTEVESPSPTPTLVPVEVEVVAAIPTGTVASQEVSAKPMIDVKSSAKAISGVGLSFLVVVLIMDVVIVEKKKIPRLVGHNLDHIMLIVLFLLFVVLTSTGVTL